MKYIIGLVKLCYFSDQIAKALTGLSQPTLRIYLRYMMDGREGKYLFKSRSTICKNNVINLKSKVYLCYAYERMAGLPIVIQLCRAFVLLTIGKLLTKQQLE